MYIYNAYEIRWTNQAITRVKEGTSPGLDGLTTKRY